MNEELYNKAKQAVIEFEQREQEKKDKQRSDQQSYAVKRLQDRLILLGITTEIEKNEFIIGLYRIYSDPDKFYNIFMEPIDHTHPPKIIKNWVSIGWYINEVEKSKETVQPEPKELTKYALIYWPHLNTEKRPFTIHGVANDGPDPYACIEYTDV